jgi:hypothetical protein
MFRKFLLAISLGVATLGAAVVAHATFSGDPPVETFDGNPVAPAPFSDAEWDVQVHVRGPEHWYSLEPIAAQHGPDCGAPPATHTNTSYEGSVFQCRDHVMTALNASDYGVIYLTPNRILDFSAGGAVQFDMSTLRMSTRDWVDIWITPYEDNLALPFDNGDVDLQGIPRRGIHVMMGTFNGQTTFHCGRIDNFVQEFDLDFDGDRDDYWGSTLTHSSATVRDTFRLEISPNHLKFYSPTMPDYDGGCDGALAPLGWTKGVVQIGHHSYTPTKDDAGVPATWHWDNISVEPSTPFSIIQADRRYVDGAQTVNFASPAPAGSNLRFSANGIVEVNFGGGWQAARIQPAETNVDRTKSYWMPIPAGTQAVQFRGQDTFNGPFFAKDFSIWSLSTSAPTATSSPVSTAPATATATSLPSTATATTTAPTATSSPTPVPPTPTPTAAPIDDRCTNRDRNDANTGWREVTGRWVELQPGLWACLVPSVGRVP